MNYINFKELFAWIIASIPYLYMGLNSGFSTEYINQQGTKLTENEMSWIGGSGTALSFISSLGSGYLIDTFGRKSLFYCTYAIHTVGWMIIAVTQYVLVGRTLISLANGIAYACTIYIAEITHPEHRGAFLTSSAIQELFGNLCIYIMAYYISMNTISLVLSLSAFILFCSVFLLPETPYWYMLKRKKEAAIKSLIWLRDGNELTIDYEINEIEKSLESTYKVALTFSQTIFNVRWLKTFLRFFVYALLFELIGFDMIIPYSEQFFAKFNRNQINNKVMSIIFVTSAFVGTIITTCIVEKFNRRSLVKNALLANIVLLVFSGFCEFFYSFEFAIISSICFCLYGAIISITALNLPWTMISENLPTDLRGTIYSAICTEFSVLNFLIVTFFPAALSFPISYIIWWFAFASLLNYIFISNFIKETRNIILPGK